MLDRTWAKVTNKNFGNNLIDHIAGWDQPEVTCRRYICQFGDESNDWVINLFEKSARDEKVLHNNT
jgi:dolichyl-phosphate-mannose--protein O-mannosyl transferase